MAVYILVLVFIWWKTSRGETKEGFLIADRNVWFWKMLLSRAAGIIGVWVFITIWGFGYQYWWAVFSYVLWAILWYLVFAWWWVPKILEWAKEGKFYTIWDYVYSRLWSINAKRITDSIIVFIWLLWWLVQIVWWAKVVSYFWWIDYWIALLITWIVIWVYLIIWWFKAVLATDGIQLIIILLLWLTVWRISWNNAWVIEWMTTLDTLWPLLIVWFFLYGIFEPYANSMLYQLCYAAKTKVIAQKSIALAWIPNALIATAVIAMWIAVNAHFPWIDPDIAFLVWIREFLNPALVSLAVVMLFAWMMSSLDSLIYSISSHFWFLFHKNDDEELVYYMKGYIAVVILVLLCAWMIWRDLIAISVLVAALSAWLLPTSMISLMKNNPTKQKFYGALCWASIWSIAWIGILWIDPKMFVIVLAWAWIWLFIWTLLSRKNKQWA